MAREVLPEIVLVKHLSVIMIQSIGTLMQDQEKIQQIILKLSREIAQICPDQKINKIVKAIDTLVNPALTDLYLTLEEEKTKINETKKQGHCC